MQQKGGNSIMNLHKILQRLSDTDYYFVIVDTEEFDKTSIISSVTTIVATMIGACIAAATSCTIFLCKYCIAYT